ITGTTGLKILDAILAGEHDPKKLAELRNVRSKATNDTIAKSLEGDYRPELLFILRQSLENYRSYLRCIQQCEDQIALLVSEFNQTNGNTFETDTVEKRSRKRSFRLTMTNKIQDQLMAIEMHRAFGVDLLKVPSIGLQTLLTLFGEVGPDFSKFRSEGAFAS